ncbi:Maf family protein [Magnetospira thiophila]
MIRQGQRLILASASRSRADILTGAGIPHAVHPADLDETPIKIACKKDGQSALQTAAALAEAKAMSVSELHPGAWIVGADQMLRCEDRWLDKPRTPAEARDHLQFLRGRTHHLETALCLARDDRVRWAHQDTVSLTMRHFSDAFIDDYLEAVGEDVTTTVGCYRLEGLGTHLFSNIEGDYFTILGLSLLPLLEKLRDLGVVRG